MKIHLKNTLTGEKEVFKPVKRKQVKMYHCGPTVYSQQHLGNISAFIYSDVLRRLFDYQGFKTTLVINVTDVGHLTSDADDGDDKVESAAKATGQTAKEITEKFTKAFIEDLEKVNIDTKSITFPRATDNIPEQIELIKELEKKDFIYKTSDGIYYDTSKFEGYGKLGSIDLEGLKEGARIEKNDDKRNPTDFALWKFSKPEEKRQQEWDSPWGIGFPGWHLECSAMSRKFLGQTFDIHLGGIEHVAIHHNNEIAQSEAAYDKKLANYWIHLNHLMFGGEKISKSTGNVIYVDDLSEKNIPHYVFRYWLLTSNYDVSSNLTWETLVGAKTGLERLVNNLGTISGSLKSANKSTKIDKKYLKQILEVLSDDLNTPQAIATIWEMMKDENVADGEKLGTILEIDKILGLKIEECINKAKTGDNNQESIPEEILKLAEERQRVREEKNWERSDEIRDQIKERGFEILDGAEGFEILKK